MTVTVLRTNIHYVNSVEGYSHRVSRIQGSENRLQPDWITVWINLPVKVGLLQKNQDHLTDSDTSLRVQDTAPILMTDRADTHNSYSAIKLIVNKRLMNHLRKAHFINPQRNN